MDIDTYNLMSGNAFSFNFMYREDWRSRKLQHGQNNPS
jgi:hypothetical protein